ncbi:heavy metal translocating P-type ATPase [Actinomadura fulvescens]|uniref:Heavy metal translocating P-type ATPase n=1 Tax=Actinomadura fulvescens TaxID=46160 RepID=A0ABP6CV47_9ACTN
MPSATLAVPAPPGRARRPPRRRTRVLEVPEARWALVALGLFLVALPIQISGGPSWLWGALYAAVYATGGWEPGWAGLKALRGRALDVDLLMVVAALGAAAIGQVTDGALLIVIFATSGALEAVATARTADSVRGLLDLAPARATRLRPGGGAEETVPVDALAVGDLVLVRPGERIAADGRVVSGESEVDQATITGEPLPVAKLAGEEVFAGTVNGTGALTVRVEREPAESVIARIVRMVEEASATKAPTQLFIEKVEQRYSIAMVSATLLLFFVPLAFGADVAGALSRAMTFMIVASPCAVVLATMPPLLSAIATAGRNGVLVKSAVVMERLAQVDMVALDKTGTLTQGAPRVAEIRPIPGGKALTEGALLALAAAAEHPSEHPLARAITEAARDRGQQVFPVTDFSSTPGVGVAATVAGGLVEAGAPARLLTGTDVRTAAARDVAADLEADGLTAVAVLLDGKAVGLLGVADALRADAGAAVAGLATLTGRTPALLTGDNRAAARRVAADVGITDVRAGLLPADKVTAIGDLTRQGRKVLFAGDGVNDAPALAAAHTGIALGQAGSDLALDTADAIAVRDELAVIPAVIGLARAARRLVVQNLLIAAAFITVLVAWDLLGHLPLPLGVAGHEGSTMIVALNGLRLLRQSAWSRHAPTARTSMQG